MPIIIQDNQVETLKYLGLTLLQAKSYLVLAQLGEADIKTIALTAKVARQDMYRIMSSLEKLGLAEKVIAEKTIYIATPINEGLNNLINTKKEYFVETQKQVARIFHDFSQKKYLDNNSEETKFTITSEKTLLVSTHEELADQTKKTIDFMLPGVSPLNLKILSENFRYINRAIKRGVKVRVITTISKTKTNTHENEKFSKELFEIRFLPEETIPFGMHIFDSKKVTLAISEKPLPSLWTNSSHIVQLAKVFFEDLWLRALSSENP